MKTRKIAKKLVTNYNRRVARNNKAFEALKPWEKRVAIARDVLAQIRTKRLVPTEGVWLAASHGNLLTKALAKKNPELQEVLGKVKQCDGCALGGMFMCAVEKADQLKLDKLETVQCYNQQVKRFHEYCELEDTIVEEDAFRYLKKFFSVEQLNLIEATFQRNKGACFDERACLFAREETDPAERMRLIMENIIKNNGKFRIEQQPAARYVTPGFVE
jgi:hypothetical protein